MTPRYLLDTNILITLLRHGGSAQPGAPAAAATRARFTAAQGLTAVSAISVDELAYGAERSARPEQNHLALAELLSLLVVLPFDEQAGHSAGRLRAALARRGTPIGPFDCLIAGHALTAGLTVVTNNRREFARVPGLAVEDWLTGEPV